MSRSLRVLVADDERTARRRIARRAEALPGVELVGSCASGEEVLALLEKQQADLLLLDIKMPGLTGLDASGLLPADGPEVVFVTAHPEHALDAFGVGAADYVLKPVDAERLRRAVERVRQRLSGGEARSRRLPIPTPRGLRLADPRSITHAVYDGTAVLVHSERGQFYADGSLLELERRLDDEERFVRVNRRALVNLDHVELMVPADSGGLHARMSDGSQVVVSRHAARQLRRRFGVG